MLLLTLLLQALALAYALVLPGVLISFAAGRRWDPVLRLAAGFVLGVLVVPTACFSAAWIMGTNIGIGLVLAVATLVNMLAGGAWQLRRRLAVAPGTST